MPVTRAKLLLAVLPLPPSVDEELYGKGVRKNGRRYRFLKADAERYRNAVVSILSSYGQAPAPWRVWQDAESIALLRRKKPAQRRVTLTVWWYFQTASSDIDNRLKALLDALKAYTDIDDRYIYGMPVQKFIDAAFPRVEVLLEEEILDAPVGASKGKRTQAASLPTSLWTLYTAPPAPDAQTVPDMLALP